MIIIMVVSGEKEEQRRMELGYPEAFTISVKPYFLNLKEVRNKYDMMLGIGKTKCKYLLFIILFPILICSEVLYNKKYS